MSCSGVHAPATPLFHVRGVVSEMTDLCKKWSFCNYVRSMFAHSVRPRFSLSSVFKKSCTLSKKFSDAYVGNLPLLLLPCRRLAYAKIDRCLRRLRGSRPTKCFGRLPAFSPASWARLGCLDIFFVCRSGHSGLLVLFSILSPARLSHFLAE